MLGRQRRLLLLGAWAATATFCASSEKAPFAAPAPSTPEQQIAALAKTLHPISDDRWKELAGAHITETYAIVQGDTLWGISGRLFGDPKYWPKVWALNNASITNPHLIRPGHSIVFTPGSGSSLPAVAVANASGGTLVADASDASDNSEAAQSQGPFTDTNGRSDDWKRLPKQRWESVEISVPPEVDPLGFDRRSKIVFKTPSFFELNALAETTKIDALGTITASRNPSTYLTLMDSVVIQAAEGETIDVGKTYALVDQPVEVKGPDTKNKGYIYDIQGRVKILGRQDNIYLAQISQGLGIISRGNFLIPDPGPIKDLTPVPAPQPVKGSLFINHDLSTYSTAQFKEVFVDRGTDDGIQPGMVFRAYEHEDPNTRKKITSADIIIDADMIVVQVSPKFCAALVMNSQLPINEGAKVVALTDVSDVKKNLGFRANGTGDSSSDLDQLDKNSSDQLQPGEEQELKQLEEWKGNPEAKPTEAPSSDELPPADATGSPSTDELPPEKAQEKSSDTAPAPESDKGGFGEDALPPGGESTPPENGASVPAPAPENVPEAGQGNQSAPSVEDELPPPPPTAP